MIRLSKHPFFRRNYIRFNVITKAPNTFTQLDRRNITTSINFGRISGSIFASYSRNLQTFNTYTKNVGKIIDNVFLQSTYNYDGNGIILADSERTNTPHKQDGGQSKENDKKKSGNERGDGESGGEGDRSSNIFSNICFIAAIALAGYHIYNRYSFESITIDQFKYSLLKNGLIAHIYVTGKAALVYTVSGKKFKLTIPNEKFLDQIIGEVETEFNFNFRSLPIRYGKEYITDISILFMLVFTGLMFRSFSGTASMMTKMSSFGLDKFQSINYTTQSGIKTTFNDVAGCDSAKGEILEFVDFLKNPAKYTRLGARIPRGALLVGPPGTGKTLLAKATAGEAKVPFLSVSGSDFVEMFVGVGPSRVRNLFAEARKQAPCIIFIDEIDAVAKQRANSKISGGNEEKESTLNQLLIEMDGFGTTDSVVVLAGTNRVDILDKAILRPGRFDRHINVDVPDITGRKAIAQLYLKDKLLDGDINSFSQRVASLTAGLTGAEISNICNEAALIAARKNLNSIGLNCLEDAVDRVIGGIEKKSRIHSDEERRTVAYHEAGHATVAWMLEHADPLLKVTIVPRGPAALGYAQYLPSNLSLFTKEQLIDKICYIFGGRASEDVIVGKISTGASNDIEKANEIARHMVNTFGMDRSFGLINKKTTNWGDSDLSSKSNDEIDLAVHSILKSAYERTKQIVIDNQHKIKDLAELLLKKETISQLDVKVVLGDRKWPPSDDLKEFLEFGKAFNSS